MTTVYKDMNADIKAFKVYKISAGKLELAPEITDIHSYNHQCMQLHHYIKAQSYKNRPEWYEQNDLKEKLILMPTIMHEHLESPIYGLSDEAFYKKYKIQKKVLLFNKRKWLETEGEKNETI